MRDMARRSRLDLGLGSNITVNTKFIHLFTTLPPFCHLTVHKFSLYRFLSVLYLTKTFVVETLQYCKLLCYVKCSTSLLT